MTGVLYKLWRMLHLPKDTQISLMRLLQNQFLIGVTGLIFNESDQVLLFKHTYRQTPWGLPGGYLKAKEHPISGLEREVEEESGLIISVEERLKIKLDKDLSYLDICYIGTFIGGEFKPSDEVSKYGLFSLHTMPLLPKNQLHLIMEALKQRQLHRKSSIVPYLEETPYTPKSFFTKVRQFIT
ncbi:NUDIX domain-containing protein [Candidatus Gottesmanbacteria bacterium]|nr:NUDIX domain-containing protein [Candidatus Gottesmanbacteria bacterium]